MLWRALKKPFMFFFFKLGGYWYGIGYLLIAMMGLDDNSIFASIILLFVNIIFFYHIFRFFKRRRNPGWGILSKTQHNSAFKKEKKILDPEIPAPLVQEEKTGVFFGEKNGKYVCQDEMIDGHVLVLGGPGSGKSTSIAIPTVRTWQKGSMFVIDIKKELERIGLTAEQRKRTKIFNPENEWETCGFDPFFLARMRTRQDMVLQDMNDIAFAIIPQSNSKEPIWEDGARDILVGILLYGFRVKNYSFIETLEWLADRSSQQVIEEISQCSDVDCRRQMSEFVSAPPNTLGSYWTTLMRPLKVFYQDSMVKNALQKTGDDGMSPRDLEDGWNIICQIPEAKLEQYKHLLTLIINQFLKFFEMRDEEDKSLKPILFLVDEAPRMGKLRVKEALATLRSKKIHIVLCAQSLSQFRGIYGKDDTDTILSNCTYKAILSASSGEDQRVLSQLAGKYDKTLVSKSTNQRDLDPFGGSGTSTSQQLRDIIPPEQFGSLPNDNQLILLNPHSTFCRVNKLPWYKDKTWNQNEEKKEGA